MPQGGGGKMPLEGAHRPRRRPMTATVRGSAASGPRGSPLRRPPPRPGDGTMTDDGLEGPPAQNGGRRWRPNTARHPRPDPREGEEIASLLAAAHGHPTSTSSVRLMMEAQAQLEERGSAIAQWQNRPRSAATLRSTVQASRTTSTAGRGGLTQLHGLTQKDSASYRTEVRHQDSLRDWHSQCLKYRHDLGRWKRGLTRQGQGQRDEEGQLRFPAFGGPNIVGRH
eukprot:Hpha_TRINITY_DN16896_c0_g1::TRINITY_DN16896_c0_g1_i1::g.149203::m.149203